MKLIVDYSTNLEGSFEKYRQNIAYQLSLNNDLYKYHAKGLTPFTQNIVSTKTGIFHRNKTKTIEKNRFDAYISFGAHKNKLADKIPSYIFIEPMIARYLYKDEKRKIRKILGKLTDFKGIIVRSEYLKLILVNQYNIEKERIIVTQQGLNFDFLNNNIDNDERNVRRVLTIYQITKPYIYISGDLDEYNAVDKFMEAFRDIHQKYPEVKLVIASPDFKIGWDNKPQPQNKAAAKILELVEDYKIFRKVVFAGNIDINHLPVVVSNAKIFADVHTRKFYSTALVEAIASKVPIIVGDAPVLKEIAQNACIAVSAKSIDSITNAMKEILSNDDIDSKLRVRCTTRIEYFSWSKTANIIGDRIKYDQRNRAKRKALIIQEKLDKIYPAEYLKHQLEIDYYEKPSRPNQKDFLSLLSMIRHYDVIVWADKLNIIVFILIRLVFLKKAFVTIYPSKKSALKKTRFLAFKSYLDFKSRIGIFRLLSKEVIINNHYVYRKLTNSIYASKSKYKYYPEILRPELKTIDKTSLKEMYSLKNYITITLRINNRNTINETLLEQLGKIKNIKVLLFQDIHADSNSKKIIDLEKSKLFEALANSKIFIDLSNELSERELLSAMYLKNVCFLEESNASKWLIHHGVNGFMNKKLSAKKQMELIKLLITNKEYLNDIRKVNYTNALQFSKDSVLSKLDLDIN